MRYSCHGFVATEDVLARLRLAAEVVHDALEIVGVRPERCGRVLGDQLVREQRADPRAQTALELQVDLDVAVDDLHRFPLLLQALGDPHQSMASSA